MLTNVTNAIRKASRNVVLNHPNNMDVQLYRRSINRTSPDGTSMGLPTMGGMGVMDSADEEAITFEFVGNGIILAAEMFMPSSAFERMDANLGAAEEFRYLLEPETEDGFEPKTKDVLYVLLGDGPDPAMLAFEVATIESTVNIPPYVNRVVLNRRDDLHI